MRPVGVTAGKGSSSLTSAVTLSIILGQFGISQTFSKRTNLDAFRETADLSSCTVKLMVPTCRFQPAWNEELRM